MKKCVIFKDIFPGLSRRRGNPVFCPEFRCHGNGGQLGKNVIGSIRICSPSTNTMLVLVKYKHYTARSISQIAKVNAKKTKKGKICQ